MYIDILEPSTALVELIQSLCQFQYCVYHFIIPWIGFKVGILSDVAIIVSELSFLIMTGIAF